MMNAYRIVILLMVLAACNNNTDKEAEVDTATAVVTEDTSVTFTPVDTSSEFIETFSSNLKPWLERTRRQATIELNDFEYIDNWVVDSLVISEAQLTPDFYKTFKPLLIFSPDSSKVLDMGSYGAMVSKNSKGQTTMVQGEPDSEIAVLDRLTRKRRRIFFFGPGSSVESGFWMNDSTIVLAGRTEEQNTVKPVIWTVKLDGESNFYKRYEPRK